MGIYKYKSKKVTYTRFFLDIAKELAIMFQERDIDPKGIKTETKWDYKKKLLTVKFKRRGKS